MTGKLTNTVVVDEKHKHKQSGMPNRMLHVFACSFYFHHPNIDIAYRLMHFMSLNFHFTFSASVSFRVKSGNFGHQVDSDSDLVCLIF